MSQRAKYIWYAVWALALAWLVCSCTPKPQIARNSSPAAGTARYPWFPRLEPEKFPQYRGLYFIAGIDGYQQSTDYTCGPAVLMKIAQFYHKGNLKPDSATEMQIAREAGTRSFDAIKQGRKPGTTPEEMKRWLERRGLKARIYYEAKGDGSALNRLRDNIKQGFPTLVEWSDLGGHWVLAVGYDTRGNDDPWDDVLILADSFDKYDDYEDGYTFVNANRFYWSWYDAVYFDKLTWRTMITVRPD